MRFGCTFGRTFASMTSKMRPSGRPPYSSSDPAGDAPPPAPPAPAPAYARGRSRPLPTARRTLLCAAVCAQRTTPEGGVQRLAPAAVLLERSRRPNTFARPHAPRELPRPAPSQRVEPSTCDARAGNRQDAAANVRTRAPTPAHKHYGQHTNTNASTPTPAPNRKRPHPARRPAAAGPRPGGARAAGTRRVPGRNSIKNK
jgi:hypothetical protein